jgi:hypothetical protein
MVVVYYGILVAWFWHMIPIAAAPDYFGCLMWHKNQQNLQFLFIGTSVLKWKGVF